MTACEKQTLIADYISGFKAVIDAIPTPAVESLFDMLDEAFEHDRQIFVIGNGGSAASASHLACDLNKTTLGRTGLRPRKRFRVTALTDNMALMTAWANDVSYDLIFAEQLRNLANPGDLLIAITGSGNSANIVAAVETARDLGLSTIGLLGFDGGSVRPLLDHSVVVESDHYGYIEDAHMLLTHLVTAHLKRHFTNPPGESLTVDDGAS